MNKLKYIHPFLFALFPALFLYSVNISLFRENVLIIPILISVIFAGIIFSVNLFLTKKSEVAAVISSFIILAFFSYSRLIEPMKNLQFNLGSLLISSDIIFLVVEVIILSILIFFVFKYKHFLKKMNKVLGVFSLLLLLMTIYNIVSAEIKLNRISVPILLNTVSNIESSQTTQKRDIYYIILDRYGGDRTIKDYGFDNSAFLDFLRAKGFYIASESTSNYPQTFLSVSSTLNMEYLDFLTQKTNGGASSDQSIVTPLVQNNQVINFLKNKGYSYIHVGSQWDPTRSNPNANLNFVMNSGVEFFADEFSNGFLQTTMLAPILKRLYPDETAVSQDPKNNEVRSRILYEYEVFNQIPQLPGPKFVFAHILIPHDPYVLGKDCEPLTEKIVDSKSTKENYLNQLQCANKKTIETIDKILASSEVKPIIIVQADEGPSPINNPISSNSAWSNASDASIKEKFPILNAYLFPDTKNGKLYPSITPVNSFRVLFNTYFKTNLALLPDKNIIFKDNKNYYNFTDITQRLNTLLGK